MISCFIGFLTCGNPTSWFPFLWYLDYTFNAFITLFKAITILCQIESILWNVPHIQPECEEYSIKPTMFRKMWKYSAKYCQSHITLLWLWIMLSWTQLVNLDLLELVKFYLKISELQIRLSTSAGSFVYCEDPLSHSQLQQLKRWLWHKPHTNHSKKFVYELQNTCGVCTSANATYTACPTTNIIYKT
jgi:hypothetical protein